MKNYFRRDLVEVEDVKLVDVKEGEVVCPIPEYIETYIG